MLDFSYLKLNNKDPVYIQLSQYVKRQILLKNATNGDELPSRRELALQLNINPNTVQKAYKLMEEQGFVITKSNQGSYIYTDEYIYSKIKTELTHDMVAEFIKSAKEINMSFKQVIDLISQLWDE